MNKKSILSLFLALLMLIGAFPLSAFAADTDTADVAGDELPFVAVTGATTVSSVNLSVITPNVGVSPSYSATVPSRAGYAVYKGKDDDYRLNGVLWVDSTTNTIMKPSAVFQAGHKYSVSVYLQTSSSSYQFKVSSSKPAVASTINGYTANAYDISALQPTSYITVGYEFAALTATNVGTIALSGIVAPKDGHLPSFAVPTVTGAGASVSIESSGDVFNGIDWRDATNYSYLTPGGSVRYIGGHKYEVAIRLKVNAGYTFNSSTTKVTVNGNNATYRLREAGDWNRIIVFYTFDCTAAISNVDITGITAPLTGNTPSYTATVPSGKGYSVNNLTSGTSWKNGVIWFDSSGKSLASTTKFVSGQKYTVRVMLKPDAGQEFASASSLSATVNGNKAASVTLNTDGTLLVNYTFTAQTAITTVAISGITAPVEGLLPSYALPAVSGTGVSISAENSGSVYNGVSWHDSTNYSEMYPGGSVKFIGGHKYQVSVRLKADTNYTFNTSTTKITVNGKSVLFSLRSAGDWSNVIVSYTFDCIGVIQKVDITGITAPLPEKTPAYTATVPSGKGYSVNNLTSGTSWRNGVIWFDSSGKSLTSSTKFVGGQKYTVRVMLKPDTGQMFASASGMSATVNGYKATSVTLNTDGTLLVDYTFTCQAITTIGSVDISITAPVPGAAPSFEITANGAGYKAEDFNSGYWNNGIIWQDAATEAYLSETSKFVGGKDYKVRVSLVPSDNSYQFSTASVSGKVNGSAASAGYFRTDTASENIYVEYTFVCPYNITSASVDIEAPQAGMSPSYTTFVTGTGYTVEIGYNNLRWSNGVTWLDEDGNTIYSYDTFEGGKKYKVRMSLIALDSYRFPELSAVSAKVNGNAATLTKFASDTIDPSYNVCLEYTFTCPESGYTVKGDVTSFLDEGGTVVLMLAKAEGSLPAITTVKGNTGSYSFSDIAAGDYILTASKPNHVTRTYKLAVSGNTEQNVKICPLGDVNNDGEITQADSLAAIRHVRLIKEITDEYQFKCADINGDGEVTQTDALGILRHVRLIKMLY